MTERTYVGTLDHEGEALRVYRSTYRVSGREALFVEDGFGEPWMRASVDLPDYDPGKGRVVLRSHSEAFGFWRVLVDAGLVSQPVAWLGAGPVVEILGEGVDFEGDIDPLVMLETGINTLYEDEAASDDEREIVRIRALRRTLQEMSANLIRQRREWKPSEGERVLEEARRMIERYEKNDDV